MKQVLVCCDGATVPAGPPAKSGALLRSLNHRGPEANVNLRIQSPSSTLLTNVDDRAADLFRLASYVYAADQRVSRGGEADAQGDDWKRQFTLYLPVSDLEFWNRETVVRSLTETLNFVSGDTWDFHFSRASPEQDQLSLTPVCLADNGVVSLNLPINGQLIGSRASRSTHPKFLRLFNRFIQQAFADGPTVTNPLWDRTRAETLKVLQDTHSIDLTGETNSCSHGRFLTRMQAHCGVCSQCIDRRFATIAAGCSENSPSALRPAQGERPTHSTHFHLSVALHRSMITCQNTTLRNVTGWTSSAKD